MTPTEVLELARQTWALPWQIDPRASNPTVISAESGALNVVIGLTSPLTVSGTLGDDAEFFEAETDDLAAALTELEAAFRRLVNAPSLS